MYSSAAMSVASTLTNTVQFTSFECAVFVLPMCPADLMLVKQKLSWQRSGPDCKCQFKNWHNSKVFKKITVFLPFFDFDQIDVRIGVFCLQNILSFSSEIDNHNPSWSWCLQTWRIVTNVVCLLDCGLVERSNSVKPREERASQRKVYHHFSSSAGFR